ncbi:AaceriAFR291Cp [[Ashbya] aceris (nom. inval.)]|nr:AaceriAFR291Cp [[Ashbya] aceris (nom. inval.)]
MAQRGVRRAAVLRQDGRRPLRVTARAATPQASGRGLCEVVPAAVAARAVRAAPAAAAMQRLVCAGRRTGPEQSAQALRASGGGAGVPGRVQVALVRFATECKVRRSRSRLGKDRDGPTGPQEVVAICPVAGGLVALRTTAGTTIVVAGSPGGGWRLGDRICTDGALTFALYAGVYWSVGWRAEREDSV